MSAHRNSIELTLYCDEVFNIRYEDDLLDKEPEYWDYIGILIVPEKQQQPLLSGLLNARCLNPNNEIWNGCDNRCRWHSDNNTEVHYTELNDTRKYKVAVSWIDFLLENARGGWDLVYFYILGLNRSRLNLERFGTRQQQNRKITIYNRFFRTAVKKSTKSLFYQYKRLIINAIYHDLGAGEEHPYFPWHVIWKLGQEDKKLSFGCNEISFINSDHRRKDGDPTHSHFIQFIDLLLGCTVNVLHYNARNKNKVKISLKAEKLLGRIIKKPINKYSRYHYFGRQRIEFFPKHDLREYDEGSIIYEARRLDNFYTDRDLKIERAIQPILFNL